jgi:hypothetical protein
MVHGVELKRSRVLHPALGTFVAINGAAALVETQDDPMPWVVAFHGFEVEDGEPGGPAWKVCTVEGEPIEGLERFETCEEAEDAAMNHPDAVRLYRLARVK